MTTRVAILDVAAPSPRVDPDTPWVGPVTTSEKGFAAMFWLAVHGLSTCAHAVAIFASVLGPLFLTLVPVPFLASMCLTVKAVQKPEERVELAIVSVPPPPVELAPVELAPVELAPTELAHDEGAPAKKKPAKKSKVHEARLVSAVDDGEMIAVLGKLEGGEVASVFGTVEGGLEGGVIGGVVGGTEENALGGLVGAGTGEAYGYGGLGLRGVGEGGGGVGEGGGETIGFGTIGALGKAGPDVVLEGAAPSALRALARALKACKVRSEVHGAVVVANGHVASVTTDTGDACVEKRVRQNAMPLLDGEHPFVVTPR